MATPDKTQNSPSENPTELDWRKILLGNPELLLGQHNTARKNLLREGVYVTLSRLTAESWVWALRTIRETAEKVATTRGEKAQLTDEVRVTIVEIPEETRRDAVSGRMVVEVDGLRAEMDSSVFYNSMFRHRPMPDVVVSNGLLAGWGAPVPTRGDTSHSTFHVAKDS